MCRSQSSRVLARRLAALGLSLLAARGVVRAIQNTENDPRLSRLARVSAGPISPAEFVSLLESQSGVKFSSDARLTDSRLILFAQREPASQVMQRIARLFKWEWQPVPSESGPPAYLLTMPASTVREEESAIRKWRAAQRALKEGCNSILTSMADRLLSLAELSPADRLEAAKGDAHLGSAIDSQGDALAGFLRRLNPEERRVVAEEATRPLGVISANNLSHIEASMRFATRLDSFAGPDRGAIERLASSFGAKGILSGAQVGLATGGGMAGIALVIDGNVYWKGGSLGVPEYPEQYAHQLAHYEAWRRGDPEPPAPDPNALAEKYGDQATELLANAARNVTIPRSLARRALRLPQIENGSRLEELLRAIHTATGYTIIADSTYRSSRATHGRTLSRRPEYTLGEALTEIAWVFRRRIWLRDGALMVQSRRYYVD